MRNFQCYNCERFHGKVSRPTCDAFSKGIPAELWLGQVDHNVSFLRKNELLFKPVKEILRR